MFKTNLISALMAAPTEGTGAGAEVSPMSALQPLLLLIIFIAFGYFFMIRPQKKQEAETKKMRDSLAVGDEITTVGGLMGRVCNIRDDTITFETGADRTRIKVARWAVRSIDKKFGAEQQEEKKPVAYKAKKKEAEANDASSENK